MKLKLAVAALALMIATPAFAAEYYVVQSAKSKKCSVATKKPASRKVVKEPDVSLGRPLVTQEEKLYMLFKDDYHARQIFEFLRVFTVRELEEFSPQQIVRRVSKPVFDTVDRIREKLAGMKRSLRDDEAFAAEYRQQLKVK